MVMVKSGKRNLIEDILLDDPQWERFKSEHIPAEEFVKHFETFCNIKISGFKKNPNDPPDYFIWIDGQKLGLEVIRLSYPERIENHNFLRKVYKLIEEISYKHRELLPKGDYFFDCRANTQANLKTLKEYLEKEIPNLFKNFSKQNAKLRIGDGNQEVGDVFFARKTDSLNTVKISCSPPEIFPDLSFEKLTKNQFEELIRSLLKKKERMTKTEPWWLLISDVNFYLNNFDLGDVVIHSNVFERIFIIQIDWKDYCITELTVSKFQN